MPKGSNYVTFNPKHPCCGKYLYTGPKSKKERHCGFAHLKYVDKNDRSELRATLLMCYDCKELNSLKNIEDEFIFVEIDE
jgi:hypothetical protein